MKQTAEEALSFFARVWKTLVGGPKELSNNNRVVNAVLVISAAFMLASTMVNVIAMLEEALIINCVLLLIVAVLYHLSRFRKMYKISFVVYAVCSYAAVIVTYFYNAGSHGPALFLFFLSFLLLIAISPKRQHLIWVVTHMIVAIAIMFIEFEYPDSIQVHYDSMTSRFFDMLITYVVTLLFIYLITIHLRQSYDRERKIAKKRAEMVKKRAKEIAKRNQQLRSIAAIQSHEVRNHVASIMGLVDLVDTVDIKDQNTKVALDGIKSSAKDLDKVIREINYLTQFDNQNLNK